MGKVTASSFLWDGVMDEAFGHQASIRPPPLIFIFVKPGRSH